jgi:hypothetical protein
MHTVFIHNDCTPFTMDYYISQQQKLRTTKRPYCEGNMAAVSSRAHNCCHLFFKFYCTWSNLTVLGYFLINSIVFDWISSNLFVSSLKLIVFYWNWLYLIEVECIWLRNWLYLIENWLIDWNRDNFRMTFENFRKIFTKIRKIFGKIWNTFGNSPKIFRDFSGNFLGFVRKFSENSKKFPKIVQNFRKSPRIIENL